MIVFITIILFLFIVGCQETNVVQNNDYNVQLLDSDYDMIIQNGDTVIFDYDMRLSNLKNRVELDNAYRRVLERDEYESILAHLTESRYTVVPHFLLESMTPDTDEVIVSIRHDIDYDPYTALKLAKLEAAYGISTTYYVLHSASYFGHFDNNRMMIYTANFAIWDSIAMLGHEIGDHNNYITMEILTELDMVNIIDIWRKTISDYGIIIYGSAAHGSALCGRYDFINYEYFSEFAESDAIWVEDVPYSLGQVSMRDMHYTYEAYHIDKDYYISDNGGRWSDAGTPLEILPEIEGGNKVIILAHPVWWDM